MSLPRIILFDRNADMVRHWKSCFSEFPEVTVQQCNDVGELVEKATVIVSPANSLGVMAGGIDGRYIQLFGKALEQRVRRKIAKDHWGELHVGQACLVPINKRQQLLCAPTMRVSSDVSNTLNAYLAFRAVLQCCLENKIKGPVLCPGFCTAVGGMPERRAASQMAAAYASVMKKRKEPLTMAAAIRDQSKLQK